MVSYTDNLGGKCVSAKVRKYLHCFMINRHRIGHCVGIILGTLLYCYREDGVVASKESWSFSLDVLNFNSSGGATGSIVYSLCRH